MEPTPIITLIVLTYNQEKFVAGAIAGALAQFYSPLQIIISDDCSTDKTFEIASARIADYEGPHSVECIQTPQNLGTMQHILHVMPRVKGDLVILAAGDDVSVPHRVQALVKAWQDTGAWALMSACDIIDAHDQKISRNVVFDMRRNQLREYFDRPINLIHGATSAYDRRAFSLLPQFEGKVMHEDALLSIALNSAGRPINLVPESLVLYREHAGSMTNTPNEMLSPAEIRNYEKRQEGSRRHLLTLTKAASQIPRLNQAALNRWLSFYEFGSRWTESSFVERLRALSTCPPAMRRWLVPRLFGIAAFAKLKSTFNRYRRGRLIKPPAQ